MRLLGARLVALAGSTPPRGEPRPLGAQPQPRVLELDASKVAHFTAFDHLGVAAHGIAAGAPPTLTLSSTLTLATEPDPDPDSQPDSDPEPEPDSDSDPDPNPHPHPNQAQYLQRIFAQLGVAYATVTAELLTPTLTLTLTLTPNPITLTLTRSPRRASRPS